MAWTYGLTYTQVNNYTTKDGLSPGDAQKIILGADIDAELSGIATALNSKLDASSISSQAEAEIGTDTESVMTPDNVTQWADSTQAESGSTAGIVGDLWRMADPAAHALLGWDNTNNAAEAFLNATNGGISIGENTVAVDLNDLGTETTIAAGDFIAMVDITDSGSQKITFANFEAALTHDSLSGVTANDHIDHSGVSVVAASNAGLTAANDDLTSNIGLEIDLTGLTQITGADIVGADELLVDDGGTNKALRWQDFGIPQTDDTTTTPFLSADLTYANRWYNCNNASAISVVIPANASVAYPVGTAFAFHQRGAGQITVSVTSDTLRSPNGAKTAQQYSTIFATKIGTTEWVITGDSTV